MSKGNSGKAGLMAILMSCLAVILAVVMAVLVITGGVAGPAGPTGPQGEIGVQGPQGEDGDKGDPGEKGKDGATWYMGDSTPSSNIGKAGDFYLATDTYTIYTKGASGWNPVGSIKGADGAQGPQGNPGEAGGSGSQWFIDAGEPDASKGKEGDCYFRTDTFTLYQKGAEDWTEVGVMGGGSTVTERGSIVFHGAGNPAANTAAFEGYTLQNHDMYVDTTDGTMWSYNGTAWEAIYSPTKVVVSSQEDLDEALSNGESVILPEGNFTLGSNIGAETAEGETVVIEGTEGTVVEIGATSGYSVKNNVTFSGVTFEKAETGAGEQTLVGVSGDNVTFEDCTFDVSDGGDTVMTISGGANNVTIKGCDFVGGFRQIGWSYGEEGGEITIEDCTFTGGVYGIHFDQTQANVTIRDCELQAWNSFGSGDGKVTFINTKFLQGSNYNFIQPYNAGGVEFIDCTFDHGVYGGKPYESLFCAANDNMTVLVKNPTFTEESGYTHFQDLLDEDCKPFIYKESEDDPGIIMTYKAEELTKTCEVTSSDIHADNKGISIENIDNKAIFHINGKFDYNATYYGGVEAKALIEQKLTDDYYLDVNRIFNWDYPLGKNSHYVTADLINKTFTIDVDVTKLPVGGNPAMIHCVKKNADGSNPGNLDFKPDISPVNTSITIGWNTYNLAIDRSLDGQSTAEACYGLAHISVTNKTAESITDVDLVNEDSKVLLKITGKYDGMTKEEILSYFANIDLQENWDAMGTSGQGGWPYYTEFDKTITADDEGKTYTVTVDITDRCKARCFYTVHFAMEHFERATTAEPNPTTNGTPDCLLKIAAFEKDVTFGDMTVTATFTPGGNGASTFWGNIGIKVWPPSEASQIKGSMASSVTMSEQEGKPIATLKGVCRGITTETLKDYIYFDLEHCDVSPITDANGRYSDGAPDYSRETCAGWILSATVENNIYTIEIDLSGVEKGHAYWCHFGVVEANRGDLQPADTTVTIDDYVYGYESHPMSWGGAPQPRTLFSVYAA